MKIGIIVHSNTGNTLGVAERLKVRFTQAGHSAGIERVSAVDEKPSPDKKVELKTPPGTAGYDALVFGCPVYAFSISSVMRAYLSQLPPLDAKKICCYVTQGLPYAWMGGARSVKQMKKILETKGIKVCATGIVSWAEKRREEKIVGVIEDIMKNIGG